MDMGQIKIGAMRTAEWLTDITGRGEPSRKVGEAGSAELTQAYGWMIFSKLEDVRKASADIETIKQEMTQAEAAKAPQLREQLETALARQLVVEKQFQASVADFLGNNAELGRAMRVIQEVQKGLGNSKKLREILDAQPGGVNAILNRAGIVHRMESHKGVAKVLKPTVFDKVVEYWKASILSGPTSLVVNFVSNSWFGATRIPYTFAAAMVSEARGSDAVMYRQAVGEAYGLTVGLVDGFKSFGRALHDHYALNKNADGKAESATPQGAIEGKTGQVVRTSFGILHAMDEMAKTIAGYMTAYGYAARQSKGDISKMVSPDFYRKHTADVLVPVKDKDGKTTHYEFKDDGSELAKLITSDGLRYTFQTELSTNAKRIMAAVYDSPFRWFAPFVIPFVRTPMNIYGEAMRQLPLLGAASAKQREMWKAGGAQRDRAAAEHLVGAAGVATVVTLVASDVLTGSGPADPGEQRAWALTHQKYSVRIGGQWYSYARIEPLATVLGLTADLWNIKEYLSDAEYEMAGKAAALAFRSQVTDKTFMQGITNLADLVTADEYGGNSFAKFVGSTVGGFVPNLLSQTDRILDPEIREARTFIDRLQNRVPYIRRGLVPVRDVFGDSIDRDVSDRMFDAFGIRVQPGTDDPVRQEMTRLGYAPKKITAREFDAMPGPLEGKVEWSDDQYDALRTQAGKMAHEALSSIIGSEGYKKAPAAYQRAIVEQVFSQARMTAQFGQLNQEQLNQAVQGAMQQLQ